MVDKIDQEYNINLQIGKYSDQTQIKDLNVFQYVGDNHSKNSVFFWYGNHQPEDKKLFERLVQYVISVMDPLLSNKYVMVYFNTKVASYGNISELYRVFRHLPQIYHENLINLYIVNPSMMVRGYTWWTKKSKHLEEKIIFMNDLDTLQQEDFFLGRYYECIPDYIKKSNHSTGIIEEKQGDIYLMQQEQQIKEQEQIGKDLDKFDLNSKGIPIMLERLLDYFRKSENNLKVQGIFRKSGFISEQNELIEQLQKKNYDFIDQIDDALIVAGCIKTVFSKMPEPVFTFQAYADMLKIDSIFSKKKIIQKELEEPQQIQKIRDTIKNLPENNQLVLYYLTDFFKLIISYQHNNQMSDYNIAVCFAPCLLRSKISSEDDLRQIGNCVKIIMLMIQHSNTIFDEFNQIAHNSNHNINQIQVQNQYNKVEEKEIIQRNSLEKFEEHKNDQNVIH